MGERGGNEGRRWEGKGDKRKEEWGEANMKLRNNGRGKLNSYKWKTEHKTESKWMTLATH